MPTQVRAALSAGVQALIALIISWLAAWGIDLPAKWSTAATTVLLGLVIAGYAALSSWLGTRTGTSTAAKLARLLSRVMTLGLGALNLSPLLSIRRGTSPVPLAVTSVRPRGPVAIIVNGVDHMVASASISYEEIATLANIAPTRCPTITYRRALGPKADGILERGETIKVTNRTVINCTVTGSA